MPSQMFYLWWKVNNRYWIDISPNLPWWNFSEGSYAVPDEPWLGVHPVVDGVLGGKQPWKGKGNRFLSRQWELNHGRQEPKALVWLIGSQSGTREQRQEWGGWDKNQLSFGLRTHSSRHTAGLYSHWGFPPACLPALLTPTQPPIWSNRSTLQSTWNLNAEQLMLKLLFWSYSYGHVW